MKKRLFTVVVFLLVLRFVFSQAGTGVFQFLELPVSSRLAALGGANVSLYDHDASLGFQNPSLLSSETHNSIGLSMANYLSDIRYGSAIYSREIGDKNVFAIGAQYVDYGQFDEANDLGVKTGSFTAKDVAINIMYSRALTDMISIGASLKPIFSSFERYSSFGVAMDLGASYHNTSKLLSAGLVLRNIGSQLKGYYSDEGGQHLEPLPFNIVLGVSKKFLHAPLRLSMTLDHLEKWDLMYQSKNQPTNQMGLFEKPKKISFVDMAFRHAVFAAEFIPSKNFYITVAYNHRRQKEMSVNGFKNSAGFSYGGGVKISKFQVGFGMTKFQVGNYSYQFSISSSLNEFKL